MSCEHLDQTAAMWAQPETVVTLRRQLGVQKASGVQEADALRAGFVTTFRRKHFGSATTGSCSIGPDSMRG